MKLEDKGKSWILSDDERPKLTSWLTINRACNLRCNWCYAKISGYFGETSMDLCTAGMCVNLIKELGGKSVILIGGEPTIHPRFFEIISLIRQAKLNAFLVTNAIRLSDEKFLEKTLNAGVSSITVSFKAADRKTFQKDTGKDYFHHSVQAVKNIVKAGVNHVVNVTACENLIDDFEPMIETVKSTGTDKFSIDVGKPIFVNGKSVVDGMKSPRQIARFFLDVYPLLEKTGLRFSVKVAVPFCLFPQSFVDKMIDDGNILTGCQMIGRRGLIFDPLGKLLPCNHLCDLFLGEMGRDFSNADEFWKIKNSPLSQNFYKMVSAYPDERCAECPYWQMCESGCKLFWLHYNAEEMIGDFREK